MAAAVIPATAWGEVEMLAARSGKAAMTIPSPRLERVDAAQRRGEGPHPLSVGPRCRFGL